MPKKADTPKPEAEAPTVPEKVRVRVLKNALVIAGGRAATGALLVVKGEEAQFHEQRGEVEIVGLA